MQQVYLPYEKISYLSDSDKAYAAASEVLRPFYKYDVNIDSFAQVIEDKKQDKTDRTTLVKVLKEQYQGVQTSPAVLENIEKLQSENTFTVITAHQPSLFTGPLYFIYKNVTAINLAKQLSEKYPKYQFVPVFWMGSEDHDFEEINHLNIFNKKIEWNNDEAGATGMMSTDSLAPTLAELKDVLGNSDNATQIFELIEKCFAPGKTYAQATFEFVNALFEKEGLVVLLSNNVDLKRSFIPYMKKELVEQPSKALVETEQAKKEAAGLKSQAFAREINLFYMVKGSRERIVWEEERYQILNRDLSFSKEEMLQELEQHPERFSPNVVLRPVFQEVILPNLCYIGGGGELAYWMERVPQFEYFGVNFPMLMRRNSVMWLDKGSTKKMDKLGLSATDIFGDTDVLIKAFVKENTTEVLSLAKEKATVEATFEGVIEKAIRIDNNLERSVKGEMTKILNALDKLEAKLISSEKKNYDVAVKQIRGLKDKLFPSNGLGLQERHDNFLSFYLKHGDDFINTLLEHQDPLNKDFLILIEE
jgi:bacillithiol biosynthesis cysteine-adding enzyme BshC